MNFVPKSGNIHSGAHPSTHFSCPNLVSPHISQLCCNNRWNPDLHGIQRQLRLVFFTLNFTHQVCSACLHDRLKTNERLLLGLVLMAERQGWENCEKANPLWLSQLLPDGDLCITSAHMPLAKVSCKATLHVSAAEKCVSYTGRGCKLHGSDWRIFSFSGRRSENLRTVVQFSMEMKEKNG